MISNATKLISFIVKPTILLGLFLIINLVLKLYFITAFPLSGDEPFTVFAAQYSFPDLYEVLKVENNPPLYFIILHFWVELTGIDTSIVRIPSLVFSVLAVIYLFKIGEKFYNLRVAIIASIIYTFSSMHMLFSHETRVYSLFTLLTVGSMYYFLKYISNTSSKPYLALIFFNALLIYAHFFGFFILFIQGLIILYLSLSSKKVDRKIVFTYLSIALLYTPYLSILLSRLYLTSSNGTWLAPPGTPMELYFMLIKFFNMPLMALIAIVIFIYALYLYLKNKFSISIETKTILLWTIVPFFLMFFISYTIPMFIYRYLAFVSIGFYLTFAIALNYILISYSKKIIIVTIFTITAIMAITFDPYKEKDIRKTTEYVTKIKALKQKDKDLVVLISPSWTYYAFTYEYNKAYFSDYKNTKSKLALENIYAIDSLWNLNAEILTKNPPIAYVDEWAELSDPKKTVYKHLEKLNRPTETFDFGGIKVTYIPKY